MNAYSIAENASMSRKKIQPRGLIASAVYRPLVETEREAEKKTRARVSLQVPSRRQVFDAGVIWLVVMALSLAIEVTAAGRIEDWFSYLIGIGFGVLAVWGGPGPARQVEGSSAT